jgi:hypothetical protein
VPKAPPLRGSPTPARLPDTRLPPGYRSTTFRWSYEDSELKARGEGVARIAPPDSVRLDFFVGGGMGHGYAFLIDRRLTSPGGDAIKRYIPPVPLLWATLGRLEVPAAAETTARVDGDTLRADIGRGSVWRATFVGDRLVRLDRIERGRLVEFVVRGPRDDVRYENRASQRSLVLTSVRTERVVGFDASIWHP